MNSDQALALTRQALRQLASHRDLNERELELALGVLLLTFASGRDTILADFEMVGSEIGMRKDHAKDAFIRLNDLALLERAENNTMRLKISCCEPSVGSQEVGQQALPLQSPRLSDASVASDSRDSGAPAPTAAPGQNRGFDVHAHCEAFRAALASGSDALERFSETSATPRGESPQVGEPLIAKDSPSWGAKQGQSSPSWGTVDNQQLPKLGRNEASVAPKSPQVGEPLIINSSPSWGEKQGKISPSWGTVGSQPVAKTGQNDTPKSPQVGESLAAKRLGKKPPDSIIRARAHASCSSAQLLKKAEAELRGQPPDFDHAWNAISRHLDGVTPRRQAEWRELAERDPAYVFWLVLRVERKAIEREQMIERGQEVDRIESPIAYMARAAREDGKLVDHKRGRTTR